MKFMVRTWLKIALIIVIVLAVNFQTIAHPFSSFDDPFILEYFGINSTLSFLDVIRPGSGFYYRPLVSLSYWLDFQLWGLDPTFMHLENVVVHLVNVFLVYLIVTRLPVSSKIKNLPVLSALLFGLHPINSESINWIAGRTDLFAGMFILFAFYCLIRAIQEQSTRFAILAFGVAFVGVLNKETAVMFLPTALLLSMYWPVVPQDMSRFKVWRTRFLLVPNIILTCLVLLLLVLVYVKGQGNSALSLLSEEGKANIFMRSFEAFGFYVKKMFLPLPLNMAIIKVDPLYVIVGMITFCVLVVTFRRIGMPRIFLVAAVLFTLPALVVAISPIAWTPYGERYLYIPSAFAVIGCLELLQRFLVRCNADKWFVPIVVIIITISLIATVQRGILWGDNLALMEDIVAKSPDFGVARNEYGVLLKIAGDYKEAEKQFEIASQQNNKKNVNRIIHLNLIGMKIRGKQQDEVRRILLAEIGNKADGDVELLKLINMYDENMLGKEVSLDKKRIIVSDIIETNETLYLKTHEPHYLYRSAQLELFIGNKRMAATYFRKAYENARPDAFYREPARKLANELGAE